MGIDITDLKILTHPFKIESAQMPVKEPPDTVPIFYTIVARTSLKDVDLYIDLLARDYDPPLAGIGAQLVHRWRTVDHAYGEAEVQSAWRLESVAAFTRLRMMTIADPSWHRFVVAATPLIESGTRRFYRAV